MNRLIISIAFLCSCILLTTKSVKAQKFYEFYEVDESKPVDPDFELLQGDSNHLFDAKFKDNAISRLTISFKDIEVWQKGHLSVTDFQNILNEIKKNLQDTFQQNISAKTIDYTIKKLKNDAPENELRFVRFKEILQDNTIILNKNSSEIAAYKRTNDTINVFVWYEGNQTKTLQYQFVIDDILQFDNSSLESIVPFLNKTDETVSLYAQKWKKPNAKGHQMQAVFDDSWKEGEQFKHRNLTFNKSVMDKIYLNANVGFVTGINLPIGFYLDATIGYKFNSNSKYSTYLGLSSGMLNPRFEGSQGDFISGQFIALDIGTTRHDGSVFSSSRAGFKAGVYYNEWRGSESKPSFYLGMSMPSFKNFSSNIHIATKFINSKQNINGEMFGFSITYNLGGLYE